MTSKKYGMEIFNNIKCVSPEGLDAKLGYTNHNWYGEWKKKNPSTFYPTTYWKNNVCLLSVLGSECWVHYYAIWRMLEKNHKSDDEIAELLSKAIFALTKQDGIIVCTNKSGMHIGDNCQPDDYENDLALRAKLGTIIFRSRKIINRQN